MIFINIKYIVYKTYTEKYLTTKFESVRLTWWQYNVNLLVGLV